MITYPIYESVTKNSPEGIEMLKYMKTLRVLCGNDKEGCYNLFRSEFNVSRSKAISYFRTGNHK